MKKKFSRILGVAVTLALVASLFGFAIPVAAQEGNMRWGGQPLPWSTAAGYFVLDNGCDVVDMAVASDGQTIYAVTGFNMQIAGPPWSLYKSTDAGQSWASVTLVGVAAPLFSGLVFNVAVAPDDPSAVAVSTRNGLNTPLDTVFMSTTGGATWAQLPTLSGSNVNQAIMDLDVAPARAGTVMSREYVIAIADERVNNTTLGDVQIIGGAAATWATVTTVAPLLAGTADYMAGRFTPNFVGDRSVVTVCADNAATPVIGSSLHIINTFSGTERRVRVQMNAAATDYDVALVATHIRAADIALPSNFDPTTVAGERSYACTANVTPATRDDVWRVDANVSWALGLANTDWQSIAYNGTNDSGILFAGAWAPPTLVGLDMGPVVRYTEQMTTSAPVWTFSRKAPTGLTGRALLRVAADYATTERVFAGTSGAAGDESAFSASNNAGLSFEQEALIDAGVANITNIDNIALTPDAGTLYLATNDGAQLSVWKSDTPLTGVSWSRVCLAASAATGMLRLNPLWDDVPAIYLADVVVNGNVYVSTDGGDVWNTRMGPGPLPSFMALQDAETAYISSAALVYKSTSSAWTWPYAPADAQVGAIVTLVAAMTDHLLVGGTNACSYSTDGGAVFTPIPVGLAADTYVMVPDEGYADNNRVYAGGLAVANDNIYRFTIGTSTAWEDMLTAGQKGAAGTPAGGAMALAVLVGLGMSNGSLYGMTATDADRSLNPADAVGEIVWTFIEAGARPAAAANFTLADSKLYVARAAWIAPPAFTLWGYDDYLATASPVVNSPGDASVLIDPVSGRADTVRINLSAMGSDTGLVDMYQLAIWEKAAGIGTLRAFNTGTRQALGTAKAAPLPVPTSPAFDLVAGAVVPDIAFTMRANTEYQYMIRACSQVGGEDVVSSWSDIYTLSVEAGGLVQQPHEGPILLGPAAGATDVSVTPGFSWTPIHGATLYEFILATDSALTQTVEDTPAYVTQPAWQVPPGTLEYDTAYFWGVRSTEPVVSVQGVGSFRTMQAPEVFTCPICGETFGSEAALSVHTTAAHPVEPVTPGYIWGIIGIGAILVIVVLVLIVRTRRTV